MSSKSTLYLFHHVFLPPKLPEEDDYSPTYDMLLLDLSIKALREFKSYVSSDNSEALVTITTMLSRVKAILDANGNIHEVNLRHALGQLAHDGGLLPIFVRGQNAAVFMSGVEDEVQIESWELSPRNSAVITTLGRLRREFPGPTLALDLEVFKEAGLQETIAHTLAKLSHQSVPGTKNKVKKAGTKQDEDRDTTHPKMVTEFFTAFLRPMCHDTKALAIQKNTREEVMWLDSRSPWRRSALWLMVRVVLQLAFLRTTKSSAGSSSGLYKQFMLYFMSTILSDAQETMSSEILHCMNAKISRRLHKLDLANEPAWFGPVQRTLVSTSDIIGSRWGSVISQKVEPKNTYSLAHLDFIDDVTCRLSRLDQYIEAMQRQEDSHTLLSVYYQPASELLYYEDTDLPIRLCSAGDGSEAYNLAAVEDWVSTSLDGWLQAHLAAETTCGQLADLIRNYHTTASSLYSSNPEGFSIMLLTILDLWIACDKSAIHAHGILSDYDPSIPVDLFQSLLLPRHSQMRRLANAEEYLSSRKRRLRYPGSRIFQDFGTRFCFPVRYFDSSCELKRLKSNIEERATQERRQKCAELRQKHQQYTELYQRANNMQCTYEEVLVDALFGIREPRHNASTCEKCRYQSQADSIQIEVHEWPLPTDPLEAKSTVFELMTPQPFASWRDATLYFMLSVLRVDYSTRQDLQVKYSPWTHSGLTHFVTWPGGAYRIELISQVKPHERTHRKKKPMIESSERDVCLQNAAHFEYFDTSEGCLVSTFRSTYDTAKSCMMKITPSSSSLQQFLLRPADSPNGPPPNAVIASQDRCPQDMSLEEYKALCTLPLGVEIQWQNILRQLAMPSVVFRKVETTAFVLQIINQAGPPTAEIDLRRGYQILRDRAFVLPMLNYVEDAAERIQENWELAEELGTLISIVSRILTLASLNEIQDRCLGLLRKLRNISFQWVKAIVAKANSSTDDGQRVSLIARSVHVALICVGTFDFEGLILDQVFQRESDSAIFFQCCMTVHDKGHVLELDSNPLLLSLYRRWQALCYRSRLWHTHNIIEDRRSGLDLAIRETWAAYRPSSTWTAVQGATDPWICSRTASEEPQECGLTVHFNLLTGALLVNGLPLARLPVAYERQKSYKMLFGKSLLEVMPGNLPGMRFSCQKKYMGWTVHMGKESIPDSQEVDLSIRAIMGDQKWHFIPQSLLVGLFPDAFVVDYAHWYNVNDGYVELRPASEAWKSNSSHWQIRRNVPRGGWNLEKGGVSLINVRSPTATLISDLLEPIEQPLKIHCKLHHASSAVEVEIPRLRLGFDLRPGASLIESRQYRGKYIDTDQSLGTLVGLHNKLILTARGGQERLVLIPQGPVSWETKGGHVRVKIGWQATASLHAYSVNHDLGHLADDGSMQSKLMLCYMHALTSYCVPDPLTQKTGTEQALSILRSSALKSFEQLEPESLALLGTIAQLTPQRRYYPPKERVMQSVQWQKGLGFLTQHADFRKEVSAILEHGRLMEMFHPSTAGVPHPTLPCVDNHLQQRDRIRSSVFRISTFGAEDHTTAHDRLYSGLDANRSSDQASRVFELCAMIYNRIPSIQRFKTQKLAPTLWGFLSQCSAIYGANVALDVTRMRYDAGLLADPNSFLASHWCSIHGVICSGGSSPDKFQLMIWLATLAFTGNSKMAVLETVASLHVIHELQCIQLPQKRMYMLNEGYQFNRSDLASRIEPTRLQTTPESSLTRQSHETPQQFKSRYNKTLKSRKNEARTLFLDDLQGQWPVQFPLIPLIRQSPRFDEYFNTQQAMAVVNKRFCSWFDNRDFMQYLCNIEEVIAQHECQPVRIPSISLSYPLPDPTISRKRGYVDFDDLLGAPPVLRTEQRVLPKLVHAHSHDAQATPLLQDLVNLLASQAKSQFEGNYVQLLQSSVESLKMTNSSWRVAGDADRLNEILCEFLHACEEYSREIYTTIASHLRPDPAGSEYTDEGVSIDRKILGTLARVHHCPRVSPSLVLQQLTRQRWDCLSSGWKHCIIEYGRSITTLQWARRLVKMKETRHELARELRNPGHPNWDPHEFPETLLMEIEHGILVRDVQEQIAKQMRTLAPGHNAVMQLNMGEGKSSVIVPIVAAALANRACLVRVLVAKPQSRQMLQMLISKLGGLLGRPIYLMPISRALQLGEAEADRLVQMCQRCMKEGGVLLVQPEHILSLQLMCIEALSLGKESAGRALLKTLNLFAQSSRDVIDESDANFSVKFELVYTMGVQSSLELSPDRWTIIHQLLDLVRMYAPDVQKAWPQSVELDEQRPGSFPRIRLLDQNATEALLQKIRQHICDNGIESLPISRQPEPRRRAVLNYLLNPRPSAQDIEAVESEGVSGFWTDTTKGPLLLLRGLLAQGVLAFCLGQKRWRVTYGPDPTRDPPTRLSVPYRAKDSPAPRSEFSHPDVVITFTLLSHYYSGLTDDELLLSFQHLLKTDQVHTEYQAWVADAPTLPSTYHHLVNINFEDQNHCFEQVFPHLRFAKAAIDYYLASVVFPKELKEFPHKISASGWDFGEVKTYPTAGFSGTNDSRKTLPLSVEQLDLPEQNHTNALVLEYLLRSENSVTHIPKQANGSTTDAQVLLEIVYGLDPPAQVILDVGAQILEYNSQQVAERWLQMTPIDGGIRAVVFINDQDDICVLDRHNRVELLQTSPFKEQLQACFVFLDEAHTRGIDLKLPDTYRAAVTLGAGITKDKLVQACMRMRKLGKGQSVIFCIPQDIKVKILSVTDKQDETLIEVSDVLRWAVSETWLDLRHSIPLWAIQGERFAYQRKLWHEARDNGKIMMSAGQAQRFLEPEAQSLEERYRARSGYTPPLRARIGQDIFLDQILARCAEFDDLNFASTQLQEEQERELAPETEQERQIQRPHPVQPKIHHLHRDVISFLSTGVLKKHSAAYKPAFKALRSTSAAAHLDVAQFPPELLVTTDFAETVQAPGGRRFISDSYERPVQWILTSAHSQSSGKDVVGKMVIISPFEAAQIQERMRSSTVAQGVRMHLYAPRQHQGYSSLDNLTLYNVPMETANVMVPESLRIQLNLFSGQLYLNSYQEYREVCDFLGVASVTTCEGMVVAADGFIVGGKSGSKTSFSQSPLKFLRVLMSQIRKECQAIDKTHIGKLLDGKLLFPCDFV